MEYKRLIILQWSEYVKVTKFSKLIGTSPQQISSWLKYGNPTLSEEKKNLLYYTILDYMKSNFA